MALIKFRASANQKHPVDHVVYQSYATHDSVSLETRPNYDSFLMSRKVGVSYVIGKYTAGRD